MRKKSGRKNKSNSGRISGFFRSFWITLLLIFCPIAAIFGMTQAYEAIRVNGFADYSPAIAIDNGDNSKVVRLFDYSVEIPAFSSQVKEIAAVSTKLINPIVRIIAKGFADLPKSLITLINWIEQSTSDKSFV